MTKNEKQTSGHSGRRVMASAAALITAASLVTGRTFNTAGELLRPEDEVAPPPAYTDTLLPDDGDDADTGDENDERRGRNQKLTLRERIARLPLALRLTVFLPLWLLGQLFLGWAAVLWPLLSPLLGHIGAFALLLLMLLGLFLLGAKALFPNVPLKKLLNKKSFAVLLIGAVALGAVDLALSLAGSEAQTARRLVSAVGSLLVLGSAALPVVLGRAKALPEPLAEAEEDAPPEDTLTFDDGAGEFTIRARNGY